MKNLLTAAATVAILILGSVSVAFSASPIKVDRSKRDIPESDLSVCFRSLVCHFETFALLGFRVEVPACE
jgi:hypothetical protein